MVYTLDFLNPDQKQKIKYIRANTEIDPDGQDDEWILEILEAFGNCEVKAVTLWKDAVAKAEQAMEEVFQQKLGHVPFPFAEHCLDYFVTLEEANAAWAEMDEASAAAFTKVLDEVFFNVLDQNPHTIQKLQTVN